MFNMYKKSASSHFLFTVPDNPQIYDLLQLSYEERKARRAAQEALTQYRLLRRERIRAFKGYIDALPERGILFAAAIR